PVVLPPREKPGPTPPLSRIFERRVRSAAACLGASAFTSAPGAGAGAGAAAGAASGSGGGFGLAAGGGGIGRGTGFDGLAPTNSRPTSTSALIPPPGRSERRQSVERRVSPSRRPSVAARRADPGRPAGSWSSASGPLR